MERNFLKISPIAKEATDTSSRSIARGELNISFPFVVNSLLVCADPHLRVQVGDCFNAVKNLIVKMEPKITTLQSEIHIVLLVYCNDEQQIFADMEKSAAQNIPTILIGDNISPTVMRKAFQYQVKDFIPLEHVSDEIGPALSKLVDQISAKVKMAPVVSIINGKGGSGASFITDCIGQVYAQQSNDNVVLFDADFHHGSLADSLGVEPEYYLTDALKEVQELDAMAIKSMMCTTGNLSLLPVKPYSHLSDLVNITPENISLLVNKIRLSYPLLIVDFSRGLELHSLPILDISDVILVVVQQNIVSIREARALVSEIKIRMGIQPQRIHLIVNRFSSKHSSISVAEIKKAVGIESALVIHNNYELANACTDLGKPLSQIHNSKQIKKDIEKIISEFLPVPINKKERTRGFWSRFSFSSNKE
ncbi:MAG: pilus assembly protein CpaE [Psychromonas sp.]|jgi:pilus assembly protein CpaE|uniref:AAA family ATPase n=1 Tax=Psychromonas sp. TaxID=1884585 RepID=UPI0039E27AFA